MIEIVTIDEHGNASYTIPYSELVLPIAHGAIADHIFMRPDIPQLGTPEFDAWLRAWHAAHNPV